jgi:hypothetical protein
MANISKEERERRQRKVDEASVNQGDSEADKAKRGEAFGGMAYTDMDEAQARLNAIDERLEDRRPGTLKDRETGEPFEDNRQFAGDLGKAANQMIGRTFITENPSPHPHIDNPGPVNWPNVQEPAQAKEEGEEVLLLRGIPATELTKHQPGTVLRMPRALAKKYVNMGVAKFTEEDDD